METNEAMSREYDMHACDFLPKITVHADCIYIVLSWSSLTS